MRRVVGIGLDGSTVTLTIGKLQIPAISASYGDKLTPGKLSVMGAQQIDETTPGGYEVDDFKIKMSAVTFRTILMPAMPKTGGGNVRLAIVVGRSHPDLGDDSDLIDGARLTNFPQAVENSNKAEEVELTGTAEQVYYTNERKTINRRRDAGNVVQEEGSF